jgi:O-antigen/teichoic acid export membrane protein
MVTLLLAARLLGPATFGNYALLITVAEMIAVISGAGYVDYLSREIARQPAAAGWLAMRLTQVRVAYIFGSSVLALLCLRLLHFPDSSQVCAAVLCIGLLPRAALESCQGVLRGVRHFMPLPLVEVVQGAALLGVAAGLLFRYHSLAGVIAAEIAANVAGLTVAALFARRWWRTSLRLDWTLPQLLKKTIVFNLYPFIVTAYDRADVFVLAKLAGSVAVGVYSMSYRILATVQILPYGVMGALLPVLAHSGWDLSKTESCSRAMRVLYSVALFVILAASLLSAPLIRLVLGPAYERSGPLLQILIWATIPMFLNYALNTTLLAIGREKIFITTATVCIGVNVAANIALVPRYSNFASAGITVATELLLFGLNLFFVRRALGHVPLPRRIGTLTAVSVGLLSASLVARAHAPELLVAGVALVLFSGYLIFDNMEWIRTRRAVQIELDTKW